VKDPASGAQPINAKAETATEKPMFRDAFRRRRCLVPADGFYEWRREDMRKQPVYICMKDREPFAFAGLWEHWENQDGQAIESCTILTTEPNDLLKPIHNRMPVILDPKDYDLWLDPDVRDAGKPSALLGPYPPEDMAAFPVSLRVNNPRNDDPECIEPL
jgi:putative SOS response-associated peptidase YedK